MSMLSLRWCVPHFMVALFLILGAGCNKKEPVPNPAPNPPPGPSGGPPGGPVASSPGQTVFQSHCVRCHTTNGQPPQAGGGPKGKMQGPDLAKVGADPAHTREWLIAFVKDPQTTKPGARMPKMEGKISEEDFEKLADYLTSLK